MPRHVALLRGINVGGKNVIKMADLKACFHENGFEDATTYIQSGNVLFEATGSSEALATSAGPASAARGAASVVGAPSNAAAELVSVFPIRMLR